MRVRTRVLTTLTLAIVLSWGAAAASAASDPEIRRSVLTPAEMIAATGVKYPLVREKFGCGTEGGVHGCGLTLKDANPSTNGRPGSAPYLSGVYFARSPAGARAYLEHQRHAAPVDGQTVELSTSNAYVTTMDWFGQGYLTFGYQVDGAKVLAASCAGYKVSRSATARCAQQLLAAQRQKAASLSVDDARKLNSSGGEK